MNKPTKASVRDLMEKMEQWQAEVDKMSESRLGGTWSQTPDPPEEFKVRVREVVEALDTVRFTLLDDFIADPAQPNFTEVIAELARASQLLLPR